MAEPAEVWNPEEVLFLVSRGDKGWRTFVGSVWAGSMLAFLGLFSLGFTLTSHFEHTLFVLGIPLAPFVMWALFLIATAIWFATRPVKIRIGRSGIGVGDLWWDRRELIGVDYFQGRIRIVPRRRPIFYSELLAPKDPQRLLDLLREAVDTPDQLEEEALREFVMTQHVRKMRDWGRVRN